VYIEIRKEMYVWLKQAADLLTSQQLQIWLAPHGYFLTSASSHTWIMVAQHKTRPVALSIIVGDFFAVKYRVQYSTVQYVGIDNVHHYF
jgi:hypothetical protein